MQSTSAQKDLDRATGGAVGHQDGDDGGLGGERAPSPTVEKRSPSGVFALGGLEEEPIIERDTGFKRRLKRLLGIFVFRQSYLDLANVHIDAAERYDDAASPGYEKLRTDDVWCRRARLVGEWQNYGVLMALIAGFAVQIYMDPPQTKVDGNATWMPTLFGTPHTHHRTHTHCRTGARCADLQ
jgi:hypothetical protein